MRNEIRQALSVCPEQVQRCLQAWSDEQQSRLEELHFRLGESVMGFIGGKEIPLPCQASDRQQLDRILERAIGQAVYSAQDTLKNGFATISGGHRLGICGRGVYKNGELYTFREISSLNLRIARQVLGAAQKAYEFLRIFASSTLIIGPPGRGKTTLLRDLIRLLSDASGVRVSVVDERMELAACLDGQAQFYLGSHSDIISGVKKAEAISLLLRSMNPTWIALDEITAVQDVQAMIQASYCGVNFLATAHASCKDELYARPMYRELMQTDIFRNLIVILPDRTLRTERLTKNA